ncbi:hypothetical protein [Candidatus Berkiella aquae]|uniref:Uncharacterized protein n=1 Tax=Candidatus Berkiella aquae TaxID=295108 RepID=A0A0Q9YY08_9GAMM|nr:hypothetical protein [Candidatus Berkiella aquae]MCS5710471.1 hypothetical protein [Candidatus Berkiella aquae]
MAKTKKPPKFNYKKLGKYPRRYDVLSEDSDKEEDKEVIADVLEWMNEPVADAIDNGKKRKDVMEMVDAGVALSQLNKVSAISTMQNATSHGHVRRGVSKLFYDLYYGARDLLSKQRVKTTLTTVAGIGAGVAIGVVLGTIVFPGIGSAIGGAIGGAIVGTTAALGGGIGLGILGGVAGSWLGKKISSKLFKEEKHYELSKKLTSKIKKRYGISGKTLLMMNDYLYNRQHNVKSPLCQRYYRMLRKNGIQKGDNVAIEKMAHYFNHELKLLALELDADPDNEALQEDKKAVLYIMRHLVKAEGIPAKTREKIQQTLNEISKKKELPSARMVQDEPEPEKTVKRLSVVQEPLKKEPRAQLNKRFVDNLRKANLGIKEVEEEHHRPESMNHSYYQYHIKRHNKPDLPDILFREVKISPNHYSAEVMVDKTQLDEENKEAVSAVLVAQARALYESTGNKHLKIIADKDDDFAIRLMAAALVADMIPDLDEREYPLDTPEQKAKREQIMEKAYAIAGLEPPYKAKTRVGFRVDFEP